MFRRRNRNRQQSVKKIRETKCTCKACGNIWFYGKEEERQVSQQEMENCGNSMSNSGKSMMCCTGCLPAVFIPDKQVIDVIDLDQCDECGSKAVEKEVVVHHVK